MTAKILGKAFNKKQSLIPTLVHDNYEANCDEAKAEMLNRYFSECCNTLMPPLHAKDQTESDLIVCLDDFLCTVDEVCHLLRNLNVSKVTGPDGISVRI